MTGPDPAPTRPRTAVIPDNMVLTYARGEVLRALESVELTTN